MNYIEKLNYNLNALIKTIKDDEIEIEIEYGTVKIIKKEYTNFDNLTKTYTIKEFFAFYLNDSLYKIDYLDKTNTDGWDINCYIATMYFPFLDKNYLPDNIINGHITKTNYTKRVDKFLKENQKYKDYIPEFDNYEIFLKTLINKLNKQFNSLDDSEDRDNQDINKSNIIDNLDKSIIECAINYPTGIYFIKDKYTLVKRQEFLELFTKDNDLITIYNGVMYDNYSHLKDLSLSEKVHLLNDLIDEMTVLSFVNDYKLKRKKKIIKNI